MSAADSSPSDETSGAEEATGPLAAEHPIPEPSEREPIALTVEARAHGWRLDHYLSRVYPNFSRELFKRAIAEECVLLNGLAVKPSRRLRVNDCLSVRLPEEADAALPAENIPIDVLHEDDAIIVVNKAADMITHPGRGNYRGTLAGALQFHFDSLSDLAGQLRPGIVHRLDRNTTGVLVVAKNNQVHHQLSSQFEARTVKKTYRAIVSGEPQFDSDYIETHIRVSPRHREKMQVCGPGGRAREAVTFYEVRRRYQGFADVELTPRTGRTHQLRVHMLHLRHPILADHQYGQPCPFTLGQLMVPLGEADPETILLNRHALHAHRLEFDHPVSGKRLSFEAPLPEDMRRTLKALEQYCSR